MTAFLASGEGRATRTTYTSTGEHTWVCQAGIPNRDINRPVRAHLFKVLQSLEVHLLTEFSHLSFGKADSDLQLVKGYLDIPCLNPLLCRLSPEFYRGPVSALLLLAWRLLGALGFFCLLRCHHWQHWLSCTRLLGHFTGLRNNQKTGEVNHPV